MEDFLSTEVIYNNRFYEVNTRIDEGYSVWEQHTDYSHCYKITFGKKSSCSCPHFKQRLSEGEHCKHHQIVLMALKKELEE